MIPISFAIVAGLFTVAGLYLYLHFVRQANNRWLTALTLPFFITLFVGGPVMGCAMTLIFQVRDSTRPVHGTLACWTMLTWIGTVGICLLFDRHRLRNWFKPAPGTARPPAGTHPVCGPAPSVHRFGYVPELDGLRGLAILDVMASHFTPWAGGGFYGVSIFFVISGFLITTLFLKEFASTNTISLRQFYRRRVARLIPALAVMLATYCLTVFLVSGIDSGWKSCQQSLIPMFFLANWTSLLPVMVPRCILHTWSLSVEEQFYILWPFMVLLMLRTFPGRRPMVLVAVLIGLLSCLLRAALWAHGADMDRVYVGLDTRADGLMAGCALALAISARTPGVQTMQRLKSWLRFLTPISALGLVVASSRGEIHGPATYYWGFSLVHLFTLVLILDVAIGGSRLLRNFLTMRWLVWAGSISYGLYLWHNLVLLKIEALDFNRPATIAAAIFMPFLIATVSYYCLEKPMMIRKAGSQ